MKSDSENLEMIVETVMDKLLSALDSKNTLSGIAVMLNLGSIAVMATIMGLTESVLIFWLAFSGAAAFVLLIMIRMALNSYKSMAVNIRREMDNEGIKGKAGN